MRPNPNRLNYLKEIPELMNYLVKHDQWSLYLLQDAQGYKYTFEDLQACQNKKAKTFLEWFIDVMKNVRTYCLPLIKWEDNKADVQINFPEMAACIEFQWCVRDDIPYLKFKGKEQQMLDEVLTTKLIVTANMLGEVYLVPNQWEEVFDDSYRI
jgi:hypothetical protein